MSRLENFELPLVAGVDELGRVMMQERDAEDVEESASDYYAEQFLEDTSEAGYTEARPHGRRSCRALASIIRIDRAELKQVKSLLGHDGLEYRDFVLAQTIVSALSTCSAIKPALSLLQPPKSVAVKGPFYPKSSELRLKVDSNWSFYWVATGKRTPEMLDSMLNLAGLFRVNAQDLDKIAAKMIAAGAKDSELEYMLAAVVIESVRTCPRFVKALSWI